MFGAEFTELLSFGKQLGLALSGAAAVWGTVFVYRSDYTNRGDNLIDGWIADRLLIPLYAGVGMTTFSWVTLLFVYGFPVFAHEGIVVRETPSEMIHALETLTPLFFVWVSFSLAGLVMHSLQHDKFRDNLFEYFIIQFVFSGILISIPALTGEWNPRQFFFFGHSFHSIMTVGTVLILDFLFLLSRSATILKQHIYPLLPILSKVIWFGLGLEFLSTWIIFDEAFMVTDKFLFMQVLIGVLIINGVLLSGPILRRLIDSIKRDGTEMSVRWTRVADVAGAVSITSWMSITFIDFFDNLTLSFIDFIGVYLILLGVLIFGHYAWEMLQTTPSLIKKREEELTT